MLDLGFSRLAGIGRPDLANDLPGLALTTPGLKLQPDPGAARPGKGRTGQHQVVLDQFQLALGRVEQQPVTAHAVHRHAELWRAAPALAALNAGLDRRLASR